MLEKYNSLIPSIEYFVVRECTPTWNLKKGIIDFYDLTYVHKGTATYFINDISYVLKPGDIVYLPKGSCRHAYTDPENPMYCYAFNFQLFFMDGPPADLPFPPVFHVGKNDQLLSLLNQFNYVWLEKDSGYMLKSRAVFMLILHYFVSVICENDSQLLSNKRIEKIKAYILNHYQNKIDMQQLARLVNINPVYLGAHFKKSTGHTVKEYITRIRIHKAYALLSSGEYTVSETANRCGFDDLFYFSKVFKKIIGIPPSQLFMSIQKNS